MSDHSGDELADLRTEVDRLRSLIGPSERSYVQLREDLLAASDVARGAEAAAGTLRGEVAALHVELVRARQDQDQFLRLVADRTKSVSSRVSRSLRARFF